MVRPCVARGIFDLADIGLASMYPASFWSFVLRAIMDISALAISLPARPQKGHLGHQFCQRREDRFLHLILHSRRPRREALGFSSVRSSACSFVRSGGRSFVPTMRYHLCSARRSCQDWPSRWFHHSVRRCRPHLDEVEHDAILKPVGASHLVSPLLRSRGPWPAPPRRCAQVCWPTQ